MFNTPILFLVFNRPHTTERVFEKIKEAKPARLYLAADGPRKDRPTEAILCQEVRDKVLHNIDWECEVHTLCREENLGCKEAVSSAITWFFENEEEGIILEDDTLPDSSFFPFCATLLEYYRNDKEVWSISGSNLLGKWEKGTASYLWGHGGIWGWATWRRAWELYDKEMKEWPEDRTKDQVKKSLGTQKWFDFYYGMFEETYKGDLNTWDIQWLYTWNRHRGKSINPTVNLVKNIGFGSEATHTSSNDYISNLDSYRINFPLVHDASRQLNIRFLREMYSMITKDSFLTYVRSKALSIKNVLVSVLHLKSSKSV